MNRIINWGIIGPGNIAHTFADDIELVDNTRIYTIASRSEKRAKTFAQKYNVEKIYTDYLQLVNDKNINIVYVSTPHSFHFKHVMLCLENNKAVLCEKPLAINYTEVSQMINKARSKNLLLIEALWTAFLPTIKTVKEIISSGKIGIPLTIRADFGFKSKFDPQHRLYNLDLGGGSLLDIGIYPIFLAYEILGYPIEIQSTASICSTGADEQCAMILKHKNGEISTLLSSILADTGVEALITGSKGSILLKPRFFKLTEIVLRREDGKEIDVTPKSKGNGFNYQINDAVQCLLQGKMESSFMTHQKSIDIMKIMDTIRKQCGIHYPNHDG